MAAFFLLTAGEVEYHLTTCAGCHRKKALPVFESRLQRVTEEETTLVRRLRLLRESPPRNFQRERRAFFSLLGRSTLQSARQLLRVGDEHSGPRQAGKHLPDRMAFLQHVVQQAPRCENEAAWLMKFYPEVLVSDGCNLCGRCVGGCPTGSITITRRTESPRVIHHRQRCCGCGLCAALCPLQVLSLGPANEGSGALHEKGRPPMADALT